MSKTLKKCLITTLTAILVALMMIVVATNVNLVWADEYSTDVPDQAKVTVVSKEYEDDFFVEDKASVRTDDKVGIKFTTIITKSYLEILEGQGEVEFIATAKKVDGTPQAVKFKKQPTSTTMSEDTFELITYLNFDKIEDKDLELASTTDFVIETYAKITNGENVSYIKAHKPEGNEIARNMRAIANVSSIVDGIEGLEKYYGERVDIHKGYGVFVAESENNVNNIETKAFKDVTINDGTVELYVGAAKYTCAVADGIITLPKLENLNANEFKYVTIFANNKAYTAKVDVCTTLLELNKANVFDKLNKIEDEYVVMTENISLITSDFLDLDDYPNTSYFKGVFDGRGYRLSGFYVRGGNSLFNICNGTIKNLEVITALSDPGGVLVKDAEDGIVVMNAFVKSGNMREDSGILALLRSLESNQTAILEDVIMYYDVISAVETPSVKFVASGGGTVLLNNCGFASVGDKVSLVADNIADGSTYEIYNYIDNNSLFETVFNEIENSSLVEKAYNVLSYSCSATSASAFGNKYGKPGLSKYLTLATSKGIDTTTWLYQDNITNLATATGGTWYLIDDVDMAGIDWTTSSKFVGTFDGLNHEISNFAGKWESGLFKKFAGTIKNVAFIDADMSAQRAGVLIGEVVSDDITTIENVYVSTTGKFAEESYSGIVQYSVHPVTFKNVIAVCNATGGDVTDGTLLGRASGTQTFDNCYVVKGPATYGADILAGIVRADGELIISGTLGTDYFIYDDINDLVADQNKNLTEFLAKYVPQA